jgi:hypothetical protein
VLKDVTGTETTYNGVENVKIANTEGNDITFRDTIDGCGQRNKILSGTFAYGYGGKIEGNIPIQSGYTVTENGTLATSGKYFSGNIEVDVPTGGASDGIVVIALRNELAISDSLTVEIAKV